MKKLLLVLFITLFSRINVKAGDLVSPLKGNPDSFYTVTHSTVSISSSTVTSDSSVVGYRSVYLLNLSPTTTIYYTLSSSTQNVTTIGWPIPPWRTPTGAPPVPEKIEYNGQINYQLSSGSSALTVTKKVIQR